MIPSTAHFVWFGGELPWLHLLAIRSARQLGGFDTVVLHHDSDLSDTPWWAELNALDGFESRPLDAEAVLGAVPDLGDALVDTFRDVEQPAGRANMVRAAILAREGGVYLDLDTVTVGRFDDLLLRGEFFCGEERIAWPADVTQGRDPLAWAGALARDAVRDGLRRLPGGWRAFRRIESLYRAAVNNAVVGCPATHPFAMRLLEAMTEIPAERRRVRYELGTSLLQNEVAAWNGPGLLVYPPEAFYPLGPEISEHWFRETRSPRVDQVLGATTRVVHWYASVRTRSIVPRVDPEWVAARRDRELFSAMVAELGLA